MILRDIFKRIADSLNLKPQEKTVDHVYSEDEGINLTAAVANRLATLTMMDSGASIDGDGARAKYIAGFLEEYLRDRMPVAAEVSLGTGDCLVKPWTDGKRIGVDIIDNENFRVCDSIGNYIRSILIRCDELEQGGETYQRFEGQHIEDVDGVSVLFINQFVFKGDTELTDQSKWPVAWQGIKQEDYIPNVDQLLMGRYKCPTVNRADVNSENGVKVTYGLDKVLEKAAEAYSRFNEEQKKKETMIFADRTLFAADGNGTRQLPPGKQKLFQMVRGKDGKELVYEFSPDMRTEQLEKGIEVNFKMLELLAGLSAGILTTPTTNYATATEMKANLQLTFAFITKFREQLVKGTEDLLNAVDIICNRNNITPMGTWEVKFDWSSSYIENLEEQFNRLMQAESIGAVENAEVRAWVMDEDLQTAEEKVKEIGGGKDDDF